MGSLSILDKLLPVWIFTAMIAGVLIGDLLPGSGRLIDSFQVEGVSLPIALGLVWMMYPPLAGVNYREIGRVVTGSKKVVVYSLLLNWVVGPFLMFALAWVFLAGFPLLRDGVILVGLARCIAMVLVWNMLAGGDNEYAALIVALNAAFQIALYSVYAYFFITVLPHLLDPPASSEVVNVGALSIAESVAVFLGVPFLLGMASRYALTRRKGARWYQEKFLERIRPTALIALLFTLVVMFSLQGGYFVQLPLRLVRVALPLVAYFVLMFGFSYVTSWKLGFSYKDTVTTSFTAASNNFELAIAVAVSVFGLSSSQAFATVVGPLIEVPVMISLVYISLWLRPRLFAPRTQADRRVASREVEEV
ncbi:MAG: ACR3 family arsenite efflux transporter [Candidatus Marsarchaeota archaeon]|nr:ACR3 family arsenite efflux transporter [Candidatus Marsarchaeota archaeon]